MPSLTKEISKNSPLHKRILRAVSARIRASKQSDARQKFEKKWKEAESKTQGFMHEREIDAIRRREREGGKPQYTTIQIPYSQAVLMSSHTYWATVFLGRSPIIQLQGLHGEGENKVLAVEALLNYQSNTGGHVPVYHTWLYDAGKYGHGIVGVYWDEEVRTVSTIVEKPATMFAGVEMEKAKKVKETRRIDGYKGNKLFNIRPVEFFHDPRVTLGNFQKGEFCGYWTSLSWSELISGESKGIYGNIKEARRAAKATGAQRDTNTNVLDLPDNDDFGTAHVDGNLAGDSLACYEMYIDLVPTEWGLGTGKDHEKWVFVIDEKETVVISARPLGAYHDKFPFSVLKIDPEGYSVYTEGIPDATEDIQNTVDWLINSHFYNVRKTLNNEYVVDPSRVEISDLKNPLPGGLIRLKPEAYGSSVRDVITQLKTVDITRSHVEDLGLMMSLGERVTGVNDQIMGVASPSSRRSATEVRSTNTFSVNRLKTTSEYMSSTGFAPLAQLLTQNSQQYYDQEWKMRLVGSSAAQLAGETFINVSPEAIAGFYDYVPVDGALPVDRFAQVNLWKTLFSEMRQIPQIMQTYDMAKIFGYVAQLAGIKNIDQFKIEIVPDGAIPGQVQQGNVVPLGGAGGGAPAGIPQIGELGPSL